jgi:RNA polymerase sigma-70 factor (family 1)
VLPKSKGKLTQEEFKNIFDAHFNDVRNYIYYRSGDKEQATEIAQETFMTLWEKNNKFENVNIKALLYKIAGHELINQYRRQKVHLKFKAKEVDENFGESPEEIVNYKELSINYELALENLPEKQRTVFLMSRMEGLKYSEIADNLGLSVKAVEKRMTNALNFIKKATGYQQ